MGGKGVPRGGCGETLKIIAKTLKIFPSGSRQGLRPSDCLPPATSARDAFPHHHMPSSVSASQAVGLSGRGGVASDMRASEPPRCHHRHGMPQQAIPAHHHDPQVFSGLHARQSLPFGTPQQYEACAPPAPHSPVPYHQHIPHGPLPQARYVGTLTEDAQYELSAVALDALL